MSCIHHIHHPHRSSSPQVRILHAKSPPWGKSWTKECHDQRGWSHTIEEQRKSLRLILKRAVWRKRWNQNTHPRLSSSRVMVISNLPYTSDPLISCHINTNSLLLKHRLPIRHCIARHQHCPRQSISILILTPNRGESSRQSFASLELILLRFHLRSFQSMLSVMLFVHTQDAPSRQ